MFGIGAMEVLVLLALVGGVAAVVFLATRGGRRDDEGRR